MTKAKTAISILALGAGLSLAGCSNWPDSLDPGSWFEQGDANNTVAGGHRYYPNLSSVPERPPPRDEEAEKKAEAQLKADREAGRAAMAVAPAPGEGLIADRADARYIDEPLRREEPSAAPPPPPAVPAQATATAPAAPETPPAVKAEPVPAPPPAPQPQVAAAPSQPPAPVRAAAPPPATPPQQAALPPAAPPPPASVPAAPEIVAMAPVRSPGDPPPSGRAGPTRPNLVWGAPPSDIDLVRRSAPRVAASAMAPPGRSGGPVARVMFASGSARLAPSDEARLREVAEAYRRAGGTVAVIGHASATAADRTDVRRQIANFSVSMDRASAVALALQRYGVPGEAIAISAETDAVALNDADGRRADVFLR